MHDRFHLDIVGERLNNMTASALFLYNAPTLEATEAPCAALHGKL
jgi:hypothetical protein